MIPVTDFIYRGEHPTADLLTQCSVKATLDLESGKQVLGDGLPLQEALTLDAVGVRCWAHPLGGIFPPTLDELRLAVAFLQDQERKQIRTQVHCKHGVDRTGMVVAAYRVTTQGWAPSRAALECLRMGMHRCYLPWLIQLWRL